LEIIDELLALHGVSGEATDLLLELRWLVRQSRDAEATLRVFCDVRRRLEQQHYLALFRIRRWLEGRLQARVRLVAHGAERIVPVKLDHYCVEAVRRVCLCSALRSGDRLITPRLTFHFGEAPVDQAPR
jgi:hypothetical protein